MKACRLAKNFAFIEYKDYKSVELAIKQTHMTNPWGKRKIAVIKSSEKHEQNSSEPDSDSIDIRRRSSICYWCS